MRRSRILGLVTSIVSAGIVVGAPALAAGGTQVQLQYNAAVFQMPGTAVDTTTQHSPCDPNDKGATFADSSVNATGLPTGLYTPSGSPVAFQMPPATGNSAVCIGLQSGVATSTTITVPSGKYTDAYFLAAVGNGPSLVDITPVYGSTNGKVITAVFPDWCQTTPQVGNSSTPNTTAGFNGGPRVKYDGTTTGQDKLPCGFYNVHVPGLDGSQTLTALTVSLEAAKTAIPDSESGVKGGGATQNGNADMNIAALTLANSASLPKTGGNETGLLIGVGLLLAGAALVIRPRMLRSED